MTSATQRPLGPSTTSPRRLTPAPWLPLLLAACASKPPPGESGGAAPGARCAMTIVFAGEHGAQARVTRTLSPDGSEVLHGETELGLGAEAPRCVVEDVRLDDKGQLSSAEVAVGPCAAVPESRVHLDPGRGMVRATTPAGVTERRAPGGAPWIYTPEVLPGRAVATPLSAWVAARAVAAAPAVVLVQLERGQAWRVPGDQVAVPTEVGTTVVLGGDGADVGTGFVDRIRLIDEGITLARLPCGEEPRS